MFQLPPHWFKLMISAFIGIGVSGLLALGIAVLVNGPTWLIYPSMLTFGPILMIVLFRLWTRNHRT